MGAIRTLTHAQLVRRNPTLLLPGSFGYVLRRARLDAGCSQKQLTQDTGVCRQQIRQAEHGQRMPNMLNVMKLADGLGVMFSYHPDRGWSYRFI